MGRERHTRIISTRFPIHGFTEADPVLRELHSHWRALTALIEARRVSASRIHHLGVKLESLRLHATKRADDHVQQNDAVFFARDVVSVADDHFVAMLTNYIHAPFHGNYCAREVAPEQHGLLVRSTEDS